MALGILSQDPHVPQVLFTLRATACTTRKLLGLWLGVWGLRFRARVLGRFRGSGVGLNMISGCITRNSCEISIKPMGFGVLCLVVGGYGLVRGRGLGLRALA